MPHNPQPIADGAFALPGHRLLSLAGRDATAFAHAQFMNDVAALDIGHWQWNGWLTPKGRVIALFALLKLDVQTLWLLLPDADPVGLATALQRFVFRSKVVLEPRDALHIGGRLSAPAHASLARFAGDAEAGIELDMGGDGGPRSLHISSTPVAHVIADDVMHWTTMDLQHGLPRLPAEQAGSWTPQQLSLDRLRAYSVKKGCYPGQEIVARTHFLGQAKRGLVLLEVGGFIECGSEVRDGESPIGSVVSSGGNLALAVVPLAHEVNALRSGTLAMRELPLMGGLAR